tara:strand:+ start:228 stop:743 length:516 start_codon:yes stop_codon:yes gene_type:complete
MIKKNLIRNAIITNIISTSLIFLYYFFILKYINKLKDNEICDKLNQPYLNIFYGIIIVLALILTISIPFFQKLLGINSFYMLSITIKYLNFIILFSLSINIFIVKLLYNISKQPKCKDIYPNFRLFIFLMNIVSLFTNIATLYFGLLKKPLSNKELKKIKKYLKNSKKKNK